MHVVHPKTELDYMEDRFYEKVLLGCQRTTRELRQNIDAGPLGGLQHRRAVESVFWGRDEQPGYIDATARAGDTNGTAGKEWRRALAHGSHEVHRVVISGAFINLFFKFFML